MAVVEASPLCTPRAYKYGSKLAICLCIVKCRPTWHLPLLPRKHYHGLISEDWIKCLLYTIMYGFQRAGQADIKLKALRTLTRFETNPALFSHTSLFTISSNLQIPQGGIYPFLGPPLGYLFLFITACGHGPIKAMRLCGITRCACDVVHCA